METAVNAEEESTAWNHTWKHPSSWADATDIPIVQGTVIMQEQIKTEILPGKEVTMIETEPQKIHEKEQREHSRVQKLEELLAESFTKQ